MGRCPESRLEVPISGLPDLINRKMAKGLFALLRTISLDGQDFEVQPIALATWRYGTIPRFGLAYTPMLLQHVYVLNASTTEQWVADKNTFYLDVISTFYL